MSDFVYMFDLIHGDVFLTFIRCLIGIVLLVDEKVISVRKKYGAIVIYFGTVIGSCIGVIIDNSFFVALIFMLVGFVISFLISHFHKTEHVVNMLLYEMNWYVLFGFIFTLFRINVAEILNMYDDFNINYISIFVLTIFSVMATIISVFVIPRIKKLNDVLQKDKYFIMGNYMIIGAFLGTVMLPMHGPADSGEMCVVLLNAFYDLKYFTVAIIGTALFCEAFKRKKSKGEN
ncbi:MAG: hypothetical protein E7254_06865 [Lachnospiraceae bacterium]|nr:hypothetical protein [Lachnospiraceae bacterium]